MSWISSISKFIRGARVTVNGGTALIKDGKIVSQTVKWGSSAGARLVTWANAAKITLLGAGAYYIFNGGLVKATSDALGIPEWASSVIWTVVAGIVVVLLIRWIIGRVRRFTHRGYRRGGRR